MKNKLQTKLQLLNPHLPDEKSIDILTYIRDINFTKVASSLILYGQKQRWIYS